MADPIVSITNGVPTSGTGIITTLGQTLVDGANATTGITTGAAVTTDATGTLQGYLRGLVKLIAAGINTNSTIVNANSNGSATSANSAPVVIANNQATLAFAADTANIANGVTGTNLTPLFATIVASGAGATTIIAAVSGKRIRVLAWDLKVNAAVNFKWQSHVTPTDLTGLYYNQGQGDGVARAFNPVGYFQTLAGEALDINLSGAVAVGGSLVYVTV